MASLASPSAQSLASQLSRERLERAALRPASTSSLSDAAFAELRSLVFGGMASAADKVRWHSQGFVFSDVPGARFGLQQRSGGPCGVLSTVQPV